MTGRPTPRAYFDRMYATDPDPWGFESRWYERRKHQLTVACLPAERHRSAFEPGCANGALSALLAPRCDRLLCSDMVPATVERARDRLRPMPWVTVEERAIPGGWPADRFDLVVLSEVAYYFDRAGLEEVAARATASLEPGGSLVAVHWRGETDYPLTGDEAHHLLAVTDGLRAVVHHREDEVALDVWQRL